MDKRELWDEFSQHIDSDIDSLQMFADRSVVTETDFYKALEKQEPEYILAMQRMFDEIDSKIMAA